LLPDYGGKEERITMSIEERAAFDIKVGNIMSFLLRIAIHVTVLVMMSNRLRSRLSALGVKELEI
jgi:predicted component of type VI protein secretion system